MKIQTGPNQWVDCEPVEFRTKDEPWAVYELADGYKLRLKLVVSNVFRTEQKDPDGNPLYLVRSTNVMTVVPPEKYDKKEIH